MAFTNSVTGKTAIGGFKFVWGVYDGTAVTTGELDPGADTVMFMGLQPIKSSVSTTGNSVDETFPFPVPRAGASKVTCDFESGQEGGFFAIVKG